MQAAERRRADAGEGVMTDPVMNVLGLALVLFVLMLMRRS
jgi:hypothetical protein